ncbi:MAG: DUF3391 domain-containing protein [Nitrospinae bacterium]|nr:DUF3391 domain-containing protein [Nitrospinota bacterium]
MPEEVKTVIKKIRTSDLRIGMYVHKVDSSWLSTPFMLGSFAVASQKDIQKLLDYEIGNVFIDTSKGLDVGEAAASVAEKEKQLSEADFFRVSLNELVIDRAVPADMYKKGASGGFDLIMKHGLAYGEEVNELFRDAGLTEALIPLDQKKLFESYRHAIEVESENRKSQGFGDDFLDPRKVEAHFDFMLNFQAISPLALVDNTKPPFSIYIREGEEVKETHPAKAPLNHEQIERWAEEETNILVRREDQEAYKAYMFEYTKNSKDMRARATFVKENSRIIIEGLAQNPRSEQLMKETKESVADLAGTVIQNPTTFYGLMKINNYDYYTFTHSVNVATLSLALAMAAGVNGKEELADLGLGAILHDIGKSRVDQKIINKPGKLTDEEYKTVTNHVMLGYEMLRVNKSISERAFLPLLQHHEKLSGKGYPNKLPAEKIHMFGRISAIIDIYDALTTERAYKKAFKPFDALVLISKSEEDFDKKLFGLFVKIIHKQQA